MTDLTITNKKRKVITKDYKVYMNLVMKKAQMNSLEKDEDYENLTVKIGSPNHDDKYISVNTWKRLNGKLGVNPGYTPKGKIKKAIAQFLGFNCWEELQTNLSQLSHAYEENFLTHGPGFINNNKTHALMLSLKRGDCIVVSFYPRQKVEAELIGNNTFRVVSSTWPELKNNDLFIAFNFVPGDVFRVMNVTRNGEYLGDFTSGLGEYIDREFTIKRLEVVKNLGKCA